MSQISFDGLEKGPILGVCTLALLFSKFTNVYKIDDDQTQPALAPNMPSQPSREERSFGDSSGPFFSIYSKAAEEEDLKMVETWHKDADAILIFVRPRVCPHAALYINITF
jgi:hypothetical protein